MQLVCIRKLEMPGLILEVGEQVELLHDLGSMYVIKYKTAEEFVVPKDSFKDAE